RTFQMASGPRKLIVDNVNGKVDVTGYNGSTVEVTVREHWRADSSDKLAEAKRDIKLDMTQEGSTVKLYVDGPFRCRDGCVDMQVPASFGGDVQFKTLNGSLYTDFDSVRLASTAEPGTREGMKYVYRQGGTTRVRLGNGGPEHRFETVNGNITISKIGQ